jgi:hypothetical protein
MFVRLRQLLAAASAIVFLALLAARVPVRAEDAAKGSSGAALRVAGGVVKSAVQAVRINGSDTTTLSALADRVPCRPSSDRG